MVRLNFVVEGHSEQAFVNNVLCPHLAEFNVVCAVRRVEFSRKHRDIHRGGLINWDKAAEDINRWRREDANHDARFTTMFDLYKLPANTPGKEGAADIANPFEKVHAIEQAIQESIADTRFLPYIQLHEFEALLFADISRLQNFYVDRTAQVGKLAKVAAEYKSPEHIDEGEHTAPSKRIIREIPEYDKGGKTAAAPIVLENIGLAVLRERCPHFGAWLGCLESLATPDSRPWPVLVEPQQPGG